MRHYRNAFTDSVTQEVSPNIKARIFLLIERRMMGKIRQDV